jgi:hypothetical protein
MTSSLRRFSPHDFTRSSGTGSLSSTPSTGVSGFRERLTGTEFGGTSTLSITYSEPLIWGAQAASVSQTADGLARPLDACPGRAWAAL